MLNFIKNSIEKFKIKREIHKISKELNEVYVLLVRWSERK